MPLTKFGSVAVGTSEPEDVRKRAERCGSSPSKTERQAALKAKFDLLARACADGLVTDVEFRCLYALLLQFHSTDSGQCHPTDAKLGRAAGGKCGRTAGTHTRSLQTKGYLTKTPTRGASDYKFPGITSPMEGRQHLSDLKTGRSATSRNKVGKVRSEGRQPVCRAEPFPEPFPEPLPKGEASPSPLNEASALPKKEKWAARKQTGSRDQPRNASQVGAHGCEAD